MPYRKNGVGPVPFGGHTASPERGIRPEKGRYRVNTFPVLRVAFGAAAAVVLFMIVHSVFQAFSAAADVLVGR